MRIKNIMKFGTYRETRITKISILNSQMQFCRMASYTINKNLRLVLINVILLGNVHNTDNSLNEKKCWFIIKFK